MKVGTKTQELEYYYKIAEQVMHVSKAFYEGGEINRIFLQRLWKHDFIGATYIPRAIDIQPTQFGQVHSNPYFSSFGFLAEALNRKAYDLAVRARCVQVLVDRGKAVGVKVISPEKKAYVLKANTVILSTSTFETPRLLLHSGIQGKAIGHYLIDHLSMRMEARMNRAGLPSDLGPLDILIQQTTQMRPYQLQMTSSESLNPEELKFTITSYGKMESRLENRVFLDPYKRDEYGVPEIQVNFSYSEKDLEVVRQVEGAMKRAISAVGAELIYNNNPTLMCLRPPGDDNHESGTCRIGDDPNTSAADRYGQIHGVSGLYVADNSMLPSLGANPTLTTVALAIRTADHIASRLAEKKPNG